MNSLAVLAVVFVLFASFLFSEYYTFAYSVTLDGQSVGYVENYSDYETIVEGVNTDIAKIINRQYSVQAEPVFNFGFVEKSLLSDPSTGIDGIYTTLYNNANENIAYGYSLEIDGHQILFASSENDIQHVIENILTNKAKSIDGTKNARVDFLNDVQIKSGAFVKETIINNTDEIAKMLEKDVQTLLKYYVQEGDTLTTIAEELKVSETEIINSNESLDLSGELAEGLTLTISSEKPLLSTKVIYNTVYNEILPYEIIESESKDYYTGTKTVATKGEKGEAQITAEIVVVDGIEYSKEVVNTVIIKNAVDEKILIGTKERPKTMATGTFIKPIKGGRVSSKYGYRPSMGDFHSGVDWSCPKGTSVYAADGGKVIHSGWQGTYGYLVIIDHENGMQTYYAHNSTLLVSKGDRVYKEQKIALSGNTGRSTGPHVHFEIRIDGDPVDPLKHLN